MTNKIKKFKDWSISEGLKTEIENILDSCVEGEWKYKDGKIYVEGNFDASNKKLGNLENLEDFNFSEVTGDFDVSSNNLKSLKGGPENVNGDFNCSSNLLESLEFSPKSAGSFYASNNFIFSLKGIPVNSYEYILAGNNIESLDPLPSEIPGSLILVENPNLTSLKGSPDSIGLNFDVSDCSLEGSLEGGPSVVKGNYLCSGNKLKSLQGAPEVIGGYFDASNNDIKSLEGLPVNLKWCDLSNNKIISLDGVSKEVAGKKFFIDGNPSKNLLKIQQNYINDHGNLGDWVEHTLENNPSLIFSDSNFPRSKDKDAIENMIKSLELERISKDNPGLLSYLAINLPKLKIFSEYVDKFKEDFSKSFLEDSKVSSDLNDLGF